MKKILHIKNMVCDRCKRVVKEELEKAGLIVKNVKLGEAEVISDKGFDYSIIKEMLLNQGFELLEDRKFKIVEQIKSALIHHIHNHKEPLKENYSDFLSKKIGKSYHTLSHLFSEAENLTIEKFIILQKTEKVKELLVYNELSLSEIAYQLGYSSVAYLSSQFKQVTGFTPSEFKRLKNHHRKSLDKI